MDSYHVYFNDRNIGYYYIYQDGSSTYSTAYGCPWDIEEELKVLHLDKDHKSEKPLEIFSDLINDTKRIPGRKRIIYQDGPLKLERKPQDVKDRFSVYRRSAEEGDPDYSPLPHDAPHYEGPHTPEDMREWASWYAFNKMDDDTYEAELDEAWWWGGGHNDGGTIRNEIPEEWFELPYEEFLSNVVCLSAAAHYGFTVEMLLKREGLKEFFGFSEDKKR